MSNTEVSKGKNFFDFIIYFIVKIRDDDIFALAAQLAYYMILSFFPFLIFLLTLIGFSNLDSMEVIGGLRAILPTSAFELIYSMIIEVIEKQNTGLLGASLLLVVWAASSAFSLWTLNRKFINNIFTFPGNSITNLELYKIWNGNIYYDLYICRNI